MTIYVKSSNDTTPALTAVTLTPTDSIPVVTGGYFRALYVGGVGNVQISDTAGNVTVFYNVAAGSILPVQGTILWNTNTTATHIVGLS